MVPCLAFSPSTLYLVSGLVVLGLVVYLARYGGRSSTINWFRLFLLFTAGFYISTAVIRCSQTEAAFQVMFVAFSLSTALVNPALFIFALYFVGKDSWLSNLWLRLAILGSTVGFIYLFWQTSFFVSHSFANPTMGYTDSLPHNGDHSELLGLSILIAYLIPMTIMAMYQRTLEDPTKKKEVRIVIAALAIAVFISIAFEGVLPAVFSLPTYPFAPFAAVTMAAMVTYAITRYGLHVFNLNNATGNLIQVMPGGLVVLDHTHTIQYINTGATEMLGYRNGKLTGASAKKLFKTIEDYGVFQTKVLAGLSAGSQVTSQETSFTTKAGQALPVSVNAVNVFAGSELVNSLISFTDITARKEAEAVLRAEKATIERKVVERTRQLSESQSQLTASVRSLPFGFAIIDRDDEVLFANDRLARFTGRKVAGDLEASKAALAKVSAEFQPDIDILACIKQSQTKKRPVEHNITRGTQFFRFYFTPVTDQQKGREVVLGTVLLMEDVTEAKTVERSRDEFFSIASHELRTPLTAIRGNTDMIKDYYAEQLKDPALKEMVADIHDSSVRLISVVNDFLDTSRLELGKIPFKSTAFSLTELVGAVVKEYKAGDQLGKLSLTVSTPMDDLPPVFADSDRLKQVILNLLSNAVKFTESGGVVISLERAGGFVKLNCTDTGKGIPLESQHLLFHKFQQASNNILTRDSTRSTGLGLYISKLIMAGMKGTITLEHSDEGKGSSFAVTVPVAKPAAVGAHS